MSAYVPLDLKRRRQYNRQQMEIHIREDEPVTQPVEWHDIMFVSPGIMSMRYKGMLYYYDVVTGVRTGPIN